MAIDTPHRKPATTHRGGRPPQKPESDQTASGEKRRKVPLWAKVTAAVGAAAALGGGVMVAGSGSKSAEKSPGVTTGAPEAKDKPKISETIDKIDSIEPTFSTSTNREEVLQNLLNNYYGYVNTGDPLYKNFLLTKLTGFQSLEDLRQDTAEAQGIFPDTRRSGKLVEILDDNSDTPLQNDVEVITFRFDQYDHNKKSDVRQFELTVQMTLIKSERDVTDNNVDDFVSGWLLEETVVLEEEYVGY